MKKLFATLMTQLTSNLLTLVANQRGQKISLLAGIFCMLGWSAYTPIGVGEFWIAMTVSAVVYIALILLLDKVVKNVLWSYRVLYIIMTVIGIAVYSIIAVNNFAAEHSIMGSFYILNVIGMLTSFYTLDKNITKIIGQLPKT